MVIEERTISVDGVPTRYLMAGEDQLPRITVPTLIIWGERDRVLPKSQARRAVSQLERGTLALIPDCGHLPQVERPDSFVTVLSRFLAES